MFSPSLTLLVHARGECPLRCILLPEVEQLALALGGGTTHHQPAADSEELEVDLLLVLMVHTFRPLPEVAIAGGEEVFPDPCLMLRLPGVVDSACSSDRPHKRTVHRCRNCIQMKCVYIYIYMHHVI